MQPTIGRTVLYTLNEADADAINRRRNDYADACRENNGPPRSGYVGHVGNQASAGEQYPATVVRVFNGSTEVVNLKVLLDGNDDYWATSRKEGEEPGTWAWPPRV